jgi:uncharacterized OB-fold protein
MRNDVIRPVPDRDSKPYWQALAEGRLEIQQCRDCGHWSWPPRPICSKCQSDNLVWHEPSGRGEVHSWVVAHRPFAPALAEEVPYTIAMVRLDEEADVLIPGRLLRPYGDIHQGMRVRAAPQALGEGVGDICWESDEAVASPSK